MIKKLFYTIILLLLLAPSVCFGANFYIDPTAGGGGDGSFADPKLPSEVDGAITNTNDYYFKCGTTSNLTNSFDITDVDGTSENRVIIGAYYAEGSFDRAGCLVDSELPIIQENGSTNTLTLMKIEGSSYVTVENLDIKHGNNHIQGGAGNSYIKITYNNIGEGCLAWGVRFLYSSDHNEISYNTIDTKMEIYGQEAETTLWDCIKFVSTSYSEIHHNTIKNWGHTGVGLDDYSHHNKVYNNYILGEVTNHCRAFESDWRSYSNEFYKNYVVDMTARSQIFGSDHAIHHNVIANTRIPYFPKNSMTEEGGGFTIAGNDARNHSGIKYYNNTFYNLYGPAIKFVSYDSAGFGTITNCEIINNLMIETGTDYNEHDDGGISHDYAIFVSDTTKISSNKFQNNVIFTTDRANTIIKYRGTEMNVATFNGADESSDTISGNIATSDGNNMTNPGADDFTLKVGADAVGAGLSTVCDNALYKYGWSSVTSYPPTDIATADKEALNQCDVGAFVFDFAIKDPLPQGSGVSTLTTLSFTSSAGQTDTDVYFKAGSSVCSFIAGDIVASGDIESVSNALLGGELSVSTDYCWQVIVNPEGENVTNGPYYFTTGPGPPIVAGESLSGIVNNAGGPRIGINAAGLTIANSP